MCTHFTTWAQQKLSMFMLVHCHVARHKGCASRFWRWPNRNGDLHRMASERAKKKKKLLDIAFQIEINLTLFSLYMNSKLTHKDVKSFVLLACTDTYASVMGSVSYTTSEGSQYLNPGCETAHQGFKSIEGGNVY